MKIDKWSDYDTTVVFCVGVAMFLLWSISFIGGLGLLLLILWLGFSGKLVEDCKNK